jgi:signal transduction histidine kinase
MLAPAKSPTASAGSPETNGVNGNAKKGRWYAPRLGFSLRLNLWYTGFFLLGTLVLFFLAYFLLGRQLTEWDREIVRVKLDAYRVLYVQGGARALQIHFDDESSWEKDTTFLEVRSTSQEFLISQSSQNSKVQATLRQLPPNLAANGTDWTSIPSGEQHMVWTVATTQLPDGCVMHVGRATEDRDELLRQFRTTFLFAIIPIVAFGFCGGAFITYRALGPIRSIIGAARTIIQTGDMGARVPDSHAQDELNELVTLFNRMLARNESLIAAMRDALDNVAHDLRTPLTRLQGGAQLALQNENPEQIKEALADAVEEAERLNAMLCTIMDISEIQAGALKLELETFPLAPIVDLLLELYDDVAQEKNITLAARIDPAGQITADRNRLQLILSNLLDNALKYTPDGGRVDLGADFTPLEVRITVRDTGIGIDSGDLPRIWDRLYRGDKSRSQRGIGLGLSLVKAFVEAHGGTAAVESRPGEGSVFTVILPRKNSAS